MEAKHCLVIGDINIDFAIHTDHYPEEGGEALSKEADFRLGGSGCATAVCLEKAGLSTMLASSVGKDVFADFAMQHIRASGVGASLVQQLPAAQTGFFMILVTATGQRTMFGNRGANAFPLNLDKLKTHLGKVDHLHISGYSMLSEESHAVVYAAAEYARDKGITISLDPGVCTSQQAGDRVLDFLPLVDWFLPSRDEITVLTNPTAKNSRNNTGFVSDEELEKSITEILSRGCSAVVLKLGKDGSLYSDGKTTINEPAISDPSRPVWNTTCAGDSFNAGFLKGMLSGASPDEALRQGNLTAFNLITSPHGLMDLINRQ
jgi:ribokinase